MPSRKAQITIFIIIGIFLLFIFSTLIFLTSSLQKKELAKTQERAFDQQFQKEALRLFVEDCLRDELEQGIILLGQQGRLWSDQPGGTLPFVEGVTGSSYQENDNITRVAYGITTKIYPTFPHAYPCQNDSNSPVFCAYTYPTTDLGFGSLPLRPSLINTDLRRYLSTKTHLCVESYIKNNVSTQATIVSSEASVNLEILDEGIAVKANYPLTFQLNGQDYFHLSTFDFFYSTKFKQFLDAAISFPLERDFRYIDFSYNSSTLEAASFTYGSKQQFPGCLPQDNYYLCKHSLFADYYHRLGISFQKEELANGDDLFTFTPALYQIMNNPLSFHFRFIRQNRPPALDYVQRESCPAANYDYLVLKEHNTYGNINITLSAIDADEDNPSLSFDQNSRFPGSSHLKSKTLQIPTDEIVKWPEGLYSLTARARDAFKEDKQDIRILIDYPQKMGLAVSLPYTLRDGPNHISYTNKYHNNHYLVSPEDPLFITLSYPPQSFLKTDPQSIILQYTSPAESFMIPVSAVNYQKLENKNICYALPYVFGVGCSLESYKNHFAQWSPSSFSLPSVKIAGVMGTLSASLTLNYCSATNITSSNQITLSVAACIPHHDPHYPYPYIREDPANYYTYQFNLNKDGTTNFQDFKGKNTSLNPFLADHACCDLAGNIKNANTSCFINPLPACYGRVEGFTITQNPQKTNPQSFFGYVQEQQQVFCDGQRGNICNGEKKYQLYQENLVCGNSSLAGCQSIPASCQNQNAYGFVNKKGKTTGWCYGTLGCSSFCPNDGAHALVFISPGSPPFITPTSLNQFAKEKKITQSQELGMACGCTTETENQPCDQNFDGLFKGKCQSTICKE